MINRLTVLGMVAGLLGAVLVGASAEESIVFDFQDVKTFDTFTTGGTVGTQSNPAGMELRQTDEDTLNIVPDDSGESFMFFGPPTKSAESTLRVFDTAIDKPIAAFVFESIDIRVDRGADISATVQGLMGDQEVFLITATAKAANSTDFHTYEPDKEGPIDRLVVTHTSEIPRNSTRMDNIVVKLPAAEPAEPE